MKLFIFDIDGTLLKPKGVGRRASERAFKKIYDIDNSMDGMETHGLTDPIILSNMFKKHLNRDYQTLEAEEFFDSYIYFLEDELRKIDKLEVLPGVFDLLEDLSNRDDSLLAVGTGNVEEGGWLKLEYSGLRSFFPFGGFGSDSGNRSELLKIAIEKGEKYIDSSSKIDDVFVIGDTPNDIIHGKKAGAKTIGVATGIYSEVDLEKHSSDYILKDLRYFNFLNL